jgi:hypothetical protein
MPKQPATQVDRYVDRPEISETFVDSLLRIDVNAGVLRCEFVVNRYGQPKGHKLEPAWSFTACRLALPVSALVDLVDKLETLLKVLEQRGVVQRSQEPSIPSPPTVQ